MNITLFAVGASSLLFAVAAVHQYFQGGLPAAALYVCFCATNTASLWMTLSSK